MLSWLEFGFGAQVQCVDGQHGKLAGLVVEPAARQVTGVIVQTGFLIGKRAYILPMSTVKQAGADTVSLAILCDEVAQYPEYREVEYEEPVSALDQGAGARGGVMSPHGLYGSNEPAVPMLKKKIREGIADGQHVLGQKMPLKNIEGKIGTLAQVCVDLDSETIIQLVVNQGMFFTTHQLIVPITVVEDIDDDVIFTTYTDKELAELQNELVSDRL